MPFSVLMCLIPAMKRETKKYIYFVCVCVCVSCQKIEREKNLFNWIKIGVKDETDGPQRAKCLLFPPSFLFSSSLAGYPPFHADNDGMLRYRIKNAVYNFNHNCWQEVSEEAKDMIRKLLVSNPAERLDIEGALKHPWLQVGLIDLNRPELGVVLLVYCS